MEPADRAAGADAQVGIQVHQGLAVANDMLAQLDRQGALVGVTAAAVKDDGEVVLLCHGPELLPARGPGAVDQRPRGGVDVAGDQAGTGRGLGLQDGPDVGRAGIHAGRVGEQIGKEPVVAAVVRPAVGEPGRPIRCIQEIIRELTQLSARAAHPFP